MDHNCILYGTGAALITPFREKGKIDFKNLEKLVAYTSKRGVSYLVLLGSTAEPFSLKEEEKIAIINCIKSANGRFLPLILGIGGNDPERVIEQIYKTDISEFECILSVSPYYNRPNQIGLYKHFKYIAKYTTSDIMIYNVPSRSVSNILTETIVHLANEFSNIVGVKEASGNILQAYEIIKKKPENFSVISGDDSLALPIILGGGDGAISVIAQGFPNQFSDMIFLAKKNKPEKAFILFYKIIEMIHLIFEEGNPTGIKALLKIIGICESNVRLPLVKASLTLIEKIKIEYRNMLVTKSIRKKLLL